MTIRSKLPYIGAALSASAYAWWVESRPRKYHPDVTWPNFLGGIALTGAWVAVRVAQGVPPLDGPPWTYIRDERIRVAAQSSQSASPSLSRSSIGSYSSS